MSPADVVCNFWTGAIRVFATLTTGLAIETSCAGDSGHNSSQNVKSGASARAASVRQLTAYLELAVFRRNIDRAIPRSTAPAVPCQMKWSSDALNASAMGIISRLLQNDPEVSQ